MAYVAMRQMRDMSDLRTGTASDLASAEDERDDLGEWSPPLHGWSSSDRGGGPLAIRHTVHTSPR